MTVPTVEQVYYEVDRRFKIELLTRLIDIHDLKLGIIFCNTKRMVDDLVEHLNAQGYSSDRLHGDMSQAMRERVINKFRKSGLEFLVATDVAARGIDVDDVQVVFNYDLPYDGEDYVHRIGRTGRAGRSGRAISFASGRELFQIQQIERYTKTKIHRGKPPTAGEVEEARAGAVLDKLRATLQSGEFKRQDHLIERLLEEGFTSTDIASALLHQLQAGETGAAAPSLRDEPSRSKRFTHGTHEPPSGALPLRHRMEERSHTPSPSHGERHRRSERPQREPFREKPPQRESQPPRVRMEHKSPISDRRPHVPERSAPSPKHSRRTPEEQTRLFMNVGSEMGIAPGDVVGAILGETGLPAKTVGVVDIRERHLFVDVASDEVNGIIAKLNRSKIKGNKLKVKVA